jgi:hypothetical protein
MILKIDKLAFMADQFSKAAALESFVGAGFLKEMVENICELVQNGKFVEAGRLMFDIHEEIGDNNIVVESVLRQISNETAPEDFQSLVRTMRVMQDAHKGNLLGRNFERKVATEGL